MIIVQLEQGVVTAVWEDADTLAAWRAKYAGIYPDELDIKEAPDGTEVGANYEDGEFHAPVIPHAPRRVGTPREFLALFTDAEKLAFFAAKSASPELDVWLTEATTGDFSLDHPKATAGLAALVSAGLLTQARADEILGADFDG